MANRGHCPPIAIVPAEGSYDYAAKYERDDTQYLRVSDDQEDRPII